MIMKRRIFSIAVGFLLLAGVAASAAASPQTYDLKGDFQAKTTEEKFVKALVNALTPESMEVVFDATPDADGTLSNVYIGARGISAGTDYRVDSLALTGAMMKLTPPDRWDVNDIKTLQPDKWEGFFNAELVLKKTDVQNALKIMTKEGGGDADKWRDLKVDFRKDTVILKGVYDVNSGMNAAFVITTGLELRGGKQIWLVNTNVQINNDEQTDAIRSEIRKNNPPIDFDKFGDLKIPLTLRSLSITNQEIRIRTATVPKPFPGTTYRYSR